VITGYDHVQVAIPAGGEDVVRRFYGELLGMTELAKPPVLARRGGCWFTSGDAVLHLGVEEPFAGAAKAHPAFLVTDLDDLATLLQGDGYDVTWGSGKIAGVRRFHTADPFGNRLEFQAADHQAPVRSASAV
jgi:catechol 2,3-dioxygenase-like lactoylglutathione lyase family enzyme